jgi:hypothetical protein
LTATDQMWSIRIGITRLAKSPTNMNSACCNEAFSSGICSLRECESFSGKIDAVVRNNATGGGSRLAVLICAHVIPECHAAVFGPADGRQDDLAALAAFSTMA